MAMKSPAIADRKKPRSDYSGGATDSVQPRFGLNEDSDSSNPCDGVHVRIEEGRPRLGLGRCRHSHRPGLRHWQRSQVPPCVRGEFHNVASSFCAACRALVQAAFIGGNYSSLLPIGCTLISDRGTTEGASPTKPVPPGRIEAPSPFHPIKRPDSTNSAHAFVSSAGSQRVRGEPSQLPPPAPTRHAKGS